MATITYKQFRAFAARLEKQSLALKHSSPTAGSIMRAATIIESRDDGKTLVVESDWREKMKSAAGVI